MPIKAGYLKVPHNLHHDDDEADVTCFSWIPPAEKLVKTLRDKVSLAMILGQYHYNMQPLNLQGFKGSFQG